MLEEHNWLLTSSHVPKLRYSAYAGKYKTLLHCTFYYKLIDPLFYTKTHTDRKTDRQR